MGKINKMGQYYFMLSEGCNLNCKYCFEQNKEKVMMPDNVVDDCIKLVNNDPNMQSVVLFGGEPTLNHKNVVKCLKEISENINVILITNGLYVNDEILKALRNRKNLIVQVSLDGNYSTMKLRVDKKEQFDKIVENTKLYAEAVGKENMFHHITITRDNINLLYENIVFLLELGCATNINTTVNNNEDYTDEDLLLYKNQLQMIKDYLLTLPYETNIRPISEKSDFRKAEPVCPAGINSAIINHAGDIYACARFYSNFEKEKYKMGSIYKPDEIKQFEHPSFQNTKCATCKIENCLRCLAANLEKNGDMTNVNEKYCKMQFANEEIKKEYRAEKERLRREKYVDLKNKIRNVQIIITKKCNFKCKYCFSDNNNKVMDNTTLNDIFNLIIENFDEKTNINFFGGEPMLEYKTLIKPFMDKLKREGYTGNFSIITNGSLFNKEILDTMMNDKMSIMLSLDGDYDTFSKNRNSNKETFDKIIDSVKYIVDNNYSNFETRLTYTRDNIKDLAHNVKYIYGLGVKKVQMYHEYDIELKDDDITELISQFEEIFNFYVQHKDINVYFVDRILHYILYRDQYKRNSQCKCGLFNENEMSFSVNVDGGIYTCHHFNDENELFKSFNIGNAKDGILKEKVEQIKIDALIEKDNESYKAREEKCKGCAMNDLCSSICIMQNLEKNENIFKNDEMACLINNVMYHVIENKLKTLS